MADQKQIQVAILKTIAYFDVFSYPLTETEIHKWLWGPKATLLEVMNACEELTAQELISYKDGLYFLKGKESTIPRRRKHYLLAQKKYKKLLRVVKILQILPFVQFIGACNTMQILDFKEASDLDIFIIVKEGRIWTTRLLVTILTALTGRWRHGTNIKDHVCLSFYVTNAHANLKHIALKNSEDPYLTYWITFVVPLLDRNNIYKSFLEQNNWILNYTPNVRGYGSLKHRRKIQERKLAKQFRETIEAMLSAKLGNSVEKFFKKIQSNKMQQKETNRNSNDESNVIISDTMLKFHEIDRKEVYKDKWYENIKTIINNHD